MIVYPARSRQLRLQVRKDAAADDRAPVNTVAPMRVNLLAPKLGPPGDVFGFPTFNPVFDWFLPCCFPALVEERESVGKEGKVSISSNPGDKCKDVESDGSPFDLVPPVCSPELRVTEVHI